MIRRWLIKRHQRLAIRKFTDRGTSRTDEFRLHVVRGLLDVLDVLE